MKLDKAIELGKAGRWRDAQVRVSPSDSRQWFAMLWDDQQKSFILADNEDRPIASGDVNELADLVRSLGLKEFTVFL